MKPGFLHLSLLSSLIISAGFAQAGDVSCQVDLLKPKFNASLIEDEAKKPAKMTVTETKHRLKQSLKKPGSENKSEQKSENKTQETAQVENKKVADKIVKKTSRLGGIFDILLPSKLRNPVK